jgi:hypothetical protein
MLIPVLYVPSLHLDRVPFPVPEQVAFFPCGLPEAFARAKDAAIPAETRLAEQAVLEALPLGPAEAKAALADMLRLGEEYAAGGLLKELAAHQLLQLHEDPWAGKPGEFADLERFAASGEIAPEQPDKVTVINWSDASGKAPVASPDSIRKVMMDCQKTLLLAWSLEERTRELEGLERRYQAVERELRRSLGEGDEAEELLREAGEPAEESAEEDSGPGESGLSWRVMVDVALPFLPEKGVLFTADTQMALDMRGLGMLQPLPEDRAAICKGWPVDFITGLLYAELPGWRLVGRKRPLPERPWLDRDIEVFVARPQGGWSQGI